MEVTGSFVTIEGVEYYKISNSQKLPPFFIQVASSSDVWIFLSSNGGITAGRKNADGNIFPYTTDDKLNLDYETGSKTLIRIGDELWQPFEQNGVQKYNITRNIYKSYLANSVIIEEINHDLSLTYQYKYHSSEKFGVIKTSKIVNTSDSAQSISVVDGLSNIMPYGVNPRLQADSSTLVDAYKSAEMVGERLAVYSLTTTINDTPYPVEMLRANIAYNTAGFGKVYLDSDIFKAFTEGDLSRINPECYGKKCGYYLVYEKELSNNSELSYSFVLDNGYDHKAVAQIEQFANGDDFSKLFEDINKDTETLLEIVSEADGIQSSGDKIACATHCLSTLYNVMRGGTFEEGYSFDYDLFVDFVGKRDKKALSNKELLQKIEQCKTVAELREVTKSDAIMHRMALEYMPLSFSRRHGDPGRPWNRFNIAIKDENGNKTVHYEGNWRDIFQNWEALGLSFPGYYENMVAKFVNASTIDGYNPYRITTDGIDWEKPEPENPFGGLGYWGDHQIIYLLRLLKGLSNHYPERLCEMLSEDIFSYANVPYVIKDYKDILVDSKNTIIFDFEKDDMLEKASAEFGSDKKLLQKDGEVYTVSLAEKLLVPVLSKISNLMPGGGIWMNAQRPEWNDANNAIVGIGLSVITVYHTKAYLEFIRNSFESGVSSYDFSFEVAEWIYELTKLIKSCEEKFDDSEKAILDGMGEIFSAYRKKVYENGYSKKCNIKTEEIIEFIDKAAALIDYTVAKNDKDTFVSYNLLKDDFSYTPMEPMLEGQAAIISSGHLSADRVCRLISSMEDSLFSKEGGYHTLYPVNKTTRFYNKNSVGSEFEEIAGIIVKDCNGKLHFDSSIASSDILLARAESLGISKEKIEAIEAEFERVFEHKKFTGRSSVMYKFEGIGCAYWHQNAKFALAVLETAQRTSKSGEDIKAIYAAYNKLLQGFIYRKSPSECKALPLEPYSHTSFNKKSEQPGMTGQVKESIIMRRGELGVLVENGEIIFEPKFIREDEFADCDEVKFSCYGLPFSYKKTGQVSVKICKNGEKITLSELAIPKSISSGIFNRNGEIKSVEVTF